jgi:hypothetical protein
MGFCIDAQRGKTRVQGLWRVGFVEPAVFGFLGSLMALMKKINSIDETVNWN